MCLGALGGPRAGRTGRPHLPEERRVWRLSRIRGERLEQVQGTVLQLQRNPNGDRSGRGDQRFERLIRMPGRGDCAEPRSSGAAAPPGRSTKPPTSPAVGVLRGLGKALWQIVCASRRRLRRSRVTTKSFHAYGASRLPTQRLESC